MTSQETMAKMAILRLKDVCPQFAKAAQEHTAAVMAEDFGKAPALFKRMQEIAEIFTAGAEYGKAEARKELGVQE